MPKTPKPLLPDTDLLWYKDAIIYQLHVKSFCDSNADGIGDFPGLTSKLDYLEKLGVSALWLLPFYPSPLRDDGYDIADYLAINPTFGSLHDFRVFLRSAHERGLRVITELVINHTSDSHEWFQKSRNAPPGSAWRDFYVWSDTPDRYSDARIIFKDFESSNWSWDPVAKAYYWHRFYSHQPDLNFENPQVLKALIKVIDFWMELGVDGMRLDAVPYLFEAEGTNCENLPPTYECLRTLRAHIDQCYPGRMLLAEANQWPEDAAAYFGNGDICNMAFHFPLMPRMFMATQMEEWYPIVDILEQTPSIPESAQWAIFLRNHDELTLEMVTDEERDYLYHYYARDQRSRINLGIRRRLAPLLNKNQRRIETMHVLLFSLPGTPIIYYGDEIGMGDNHYLGDRDGVRTPMQWTADRNAGFSTTNPQQLYLPVIIDPEYHFETVNVQTQEQNLSSMLWWTRRVIAMRRRYPAFARGTIRFLHHANPAVLAFIRTLSTQSLLIVVNLSRFAQAIELDLADFAGAIPEDVFSSNRFPAIRSTPYVLTMGQHDYFWLELRRDLGDERHESQRTIPQLQTQSHWVQLLTGRDRLAFENSVLLPYLQGRTSAGYRPLPLRQANIEQVLPVHEPGFDAALLLVRVHFSGKDSDLLFLPLCLCPERDVAALSGGNDGLVAARVKGASHGAIIDAMLHPQLFRLFHKVMRSQKKVTGRSLTLEGYATRSFSKSLILPHKISFVKGGRRNTSLALDNRCYCKLYRRLDAGPNPDIELNAYLSSSHNDNSPVPPFLGAVSLCDSRGERYTIAMLSQWADHAGDLWHGAFDAAQHYFDTLLGLEQFTAPDKTQSLTALYPESDSEPASTLPTPLFADTAHALGKRVAAMHENLARSSTNPAFAPEPFTMLYQRSLYQTRRSKTTKLLKLRGSAQLDLPPATQEMLNETLRDSDALNRMYAFILNRKFPCFKTRMHGDLHLGQILAGGTEFMIRDFEGPKGRSLSERRIKRSSLRDLASLILSIHAAGVGALQRKSALPQRDYQRLHPWTQLWTNAVAAAFLDGYKSGVADSSTLALSDEDTALLLRMFLYASAANELLEPAESTPILLQASAEMIVLCTATEFPFER